jgi:hypothetical protein
MPSAAVAVFEWLMLECSIVNINRSLVIGNKIANLNELKMSLSSMPVY